jgi:conjugal transfer mating pair stabilization protein TraG
MSTVTVANQDQALMALCLWREARGEGADGMKAVACVIRNRVLRRHTSYAIEVMRPWQFTSMTDPKDPEYRLMPDPKDASWGKAQAVAEMAIAGVLPDVTQGATLYWNPAGIRSDRTFQLLDGDVVRFPEHWNAAAVKESARIGKHIFLREV